MNTLLHSPLHETMSNANMPNLELLRATTFNNRGATYIQTGEFDRAIHRLTTALDTISKHANTEEYDDGSSTTHGGDLDRFMAPISIEEQDKDSSLEEYSFFYRNSIKIPTSILENGNSGKSKVLEMVTVAILFNLALAHHFAAMECNEPRLNQLRKAMKFYELGFEVHGQADLSSLQFHLASVNNLGHVLQVLGEKEKSDQCFRNLLSTLMYLIDGGSLDGRYCEGFFQNVSHLIFANESVAAHAA